MTSPSPSPALARRLGLGDAVIIGLGSMMGAGIFSAFAPAAAAAGAGLLIGLVIAGVIAVCNALSSAQLAAQYPTSGGTYIYGRERLGEWPGFVAGWSFVIGKTASCAAMALTVAAYAAPAGWEKPVAVVAVIALATVNSFGITRTAGLTRVIVVVVLLVLAFVVVVGATKIASTGTGLAGTGLASTGLANLAGPDAGSWYGILQSGGLLFFAFAGYARIATMGEEVKNPARTIPRAIIIALSITLAVYAVVAVIVLAVLGPEQLASSAAPLVDVITGASGSGGAGVSGGADSAASAGAVIVRIGAAAAALGALLALIAGVGRTTLAMARNRDLPSWLAAVHPVRQVPIHAEVALAVVVVILVLTTDLRGAIGFSSFGVLLYYLVANAAAITQPRGTRRYPQAVQVVGGLGCLVLVATLPLASIAVGVGVLAVGVVYRLITLRFTPADGDVTRAAKR
ncbi:MAG: APC family permease [Herbiconiux sp.]|uniref:APC family permease n=1 Tax=Herbiconiux sp. TaxID=1871186 RepID=UPI001226CFF9|nr:APC family permease [Herbiconiux sp.]TAJ50261.1 MAG: APC family permease [Herbiconiux sp.]